MAIKRPPLPRLRRLRDMRPNLRDHGGTKGHVWHEMAIHDIDVQPIGAPVHRVCTFGAQSGEIGAEDGGSDDGGGRHDVILRRRRMSLPASGSS